MHGGPLADDLAVRTRVIDLIRRHPGQVIGRDVADAVAAGLDGVHLHGGKFGEDVRHVRKLRPVQLQVLPGREVAEAAVVAARDVGELVQLGSAQQSVRDRDAQHRRMALDVQSVAQAQRAELLLGQLPGEVAARLVAEFRDALIDNCLIQLIVLIHAKDYRGARRGL